MCSIPIESQVGYEGRLSVVSESQVHQDGLQRYLVQARWLLLLPSLGAVVGAVFYRVPSPVAVHLWRTEPSRWSWICFLSAFALRAGLAFALGLAVGLRTELSFTDHCVLQGAKNIQRIVSIFARFSEYTESIVQSKIYVREEEANEAEVNQRGRICMRAFAELERP